ncbi:phospholipase A1-Igamma1, chloroplastic-like, partial [Musa troglodytarum]
VSPLSASEAASSWTCLSPPPPSTATRSPSPSTPSKRRRPQNAGYTSRRLSLTFSASAARRSPTPGSLTSQTPPSTTLRPSPRKKTSPPSSRISTGRADWCRLLDPLHPWLRREIIKYGELAQATYDGFDFNPFSEICGSCLYGPHRLLDKLGLSRSGYEVSGYVYAMSHVDLPAWLERSIHADAWSAESNWLGFVAVSDDEESRRIGCRDVVVAWRGTIAPTEWFESVEGKLEPLGDGHGAVKVEHGFLGVYASKSERTRCNKTSASEQVMAEIKRLVKRYRRQGEEVSLTITGHSLGGALALLNAYEAASAMPDLPVSVISSGAPRVGNAAFGDRLKEMNVKVLRVVVKQDVVPKMPGILFNEGLKRLESVTGKLGWVYSHVGLELGLDVRSSPFLKRGIDVAGFHNLEAYLHLVDGFRSSDDGLRSSFKRDVALVNEAGGMLRDDLKIPPCWYPAANKGMVCNAHGRWMKPAREPEDIPSPPAQTPDPCQA